MPIYTYRCENCGVQFEQTQKFTDKPLTRCPECRKNTLRKVYTPVGIVFKGSGFYATDHRSPSGMAPSSKSEEKTGDSAGKTEGKSESGSKSDKKDQAAATTTPTSAPAKPEPNK